MGWLEGLLTGYTGRHREIEDQKRVEAAAAADREGRVYEALLNSPDPEVQKMAAAGMLGSTAPRRKKSGFAGWMGEMERSPHMAAIQRYHDNLNATGGVDEEEAPPIGPDLAGQIATPPAAAGSAALPATSVTVPGSPRLTQPTFGPGPGGAAAPPPAPPGFSLAPGAGAGPAASAGAPPGAAPYTGLPAAGPTANMAPGAAGAVAGALPGGSGQLLAGGPGAQAGAVPPQPGAAPPQPSGPNVAAAQPGVLASGPPAPPPPPPGKTSLSGAPPARSRRTQLSIFPNAAYVKGQAAEAEVSGTIAGYTEMYRRMGLPEDQAAARAAQLYEREHVRASRGTGSGAGVAEGNPRQLEDGTWVQDLYDKGTGEVVNTIPHQGIGGTGTVQERELLAIKLFGRQHPGVPPKALMHQLSPKEADVLTEEISRQKGYSAATGAVMKAEAMANAPLAASARQGLTNFLIQDWEKYKKPMREMQRQSVLMDQGLAALQRGDAVGGSQAILVTFQKILDPESVVRESEYDRSIGALPVLDQMRGYWQKYVGTTPADPRAIDQWISSGVAIPIDELQKMAVTAKAFIAGLATQEQADRQRIEQRATDNGIPSEYIFGGPRTSPPSPPSVGVGAAPGVAPAALTPTGAPRTARPAAAAGPGPEWENRNGVIYHNGQPF